MTGGKGLSRFGAKRQNNLEARVGIEPTHKGFADLSLTTWVPRLACQTHVEILRLAPLAQDFACGLTPAKRLNLGTAPE